MLSEVRNAEPLAELIEHLSGRSRPPEMTLRLMSGAGLHSVLDAASRLPWITVDIGVESLVPYYRRARMAVVPAARATGVKATILQAWSCACPVAALTSSARTVGNSNSRAILSAPTPSELADQIVGAWNDDERLDQLVDLGRAAMANDFNDDAAQLTWKDSLRGAMAQSNDRG